MPISAKRKREIRLEKRKVIQQIKSSSECSMCGESRWYCLDYHHKGDKVDSISNLMKGHINIDKIKKEMKKCDVLCANCHREVHYQERVMGIEREKKKIESEVMLWDI